MNGCVFCRIVAGKEPARIVYEDDRILAFEDIRPQGPDHTLVIPKRHVATLAELRSEDAPLIGKMVLAASRIAAERGIAARGFRLVANCNRDGGQTIYHLHLHLIGGRAMGWPPG
jgi:histidine triad (HIT) family protein